MGQTNTRKMPENKWHQSQRGYFAGALYNAMLENKSIFCLTGDLGFGMLNHIRDDFPDRYLNCGAAETSMIGIACGLALEGKIPFVYSITTFLLYRPFEVLRTYVNHEKIPVKLVGSGRDQDYKHDGFSHDSSDVKLLFGGYRAGEGQGILKNINSHFPETKEEIPKIVDAMIKSGMPEFISLRR